MRFSQVRLERNNFTGSVSYQHSTTTQFFRQQSVGQTLTVDAANYGMVLLQILPNTDTSVVVGTERDVRETVYLAVLVLLACLELVYHLVSQWRRQKKVARPSETHSLLDVSQDLSEKKSPPTSESEDWLDPPPNKNFKKKSMLIKYLEYGEFDFLPSPFTNIFFFFVFFFSTFLFVERVFVMRLRSVASVGSSSIQS